MFKRVFTFLVCVWLLWSLFDGIFLSHQSGANGYGGFPMTATNDLRSFLAAHGFKPCPPTVLIADPARTREYFRGNYQGSRPFIVVVSIKVADRYGVSVDTSWDFSGFSWRVSDSSKKADDFAEMLNHWLTDYRERSLNAKPSA
jgi:hypothetical protein